MLKIPVAYTRYALAALATVGFVLSVVGFALAVVGLALTAN